MVGLAGVSVISWTLGGPDGRLVRWRSAACGVVRRAGDESVVLIEKTPATGSRTNMETQCPRELGGSGGGRVTGSCRRFRRGAVRHTPQMTPEQFDGKRCVSRT